MKMLSIYIKQIKKNWLSWSIISVFTAGFSFLMVLLWPSFEPYIEMLDEMMKLPLYQAMLGGESGLSTIEDLLGLELYLISDIFFMGLILLFGVQCIPREVESGSLDFLLSFPVLRWRLLLEKLFAFITITISFPILTTVGAILGAAITPGIEFQPRGLEAFFLGLFSRWILYITLSCIVILISIIFMDSGKTLGFGALIVGGSFILDMLGGLVLMADPVLGDQIQHTSLYFYLDGTTTMNKVITEGYSAFPFLEMLFILAIGVGSIILSIVIFDNPFRQKREFK